MTILIRSAQLFIEFISGVITGFDGHSVDA